MSNVDGPSADSAAGSQAVTDSVAAPAHAGAAAEGVAEAEALAAVDAIITSFGNHERDGVCLLRNAHACAMAQADGGWHGGFHRMMGKLPRQ